MRIIVATLGAVLVQPFLGIAYVFGPFIGAGESLPYSQMFDFAKWVILVAAALVMVLGIPTYYALKRYGEATKQGVAFAGFALSSIPTALLGWPRHTVGYSSGANWHGTYVDLYKDGVPTTYAWLSHFESVFWFGLHGFLGAIVFYLIMSSGNEPQQRVSADGRASGPQV